jgi:hypothetical protein
MTQQMTIQTGPVENHGPDTDVLYALNDAIGQVAADWGLLDRFDGDDRDDTLNDAVHAAFNILRQRETA